jgi:hypothetical protein
MTHPVESRRLAVRQAHRPRPQRLAFRATGCQPEILPSTPRLSVIGSAVLGGSRCMPSTVSLMPPGLPSRTSGLAL